MDRSEIKRRFPTLTLIDGMLTSELGPDTLAALLTPPSFPLDSMGNFASGPDIQPLVGAFLAAYFARFDAARESLASAYASDATFSLALNMTVPHRAKFHGLLHSLPHQKDLKFNDLIDLGSRNMRQIRPPTSAHAAQNDKRARFLHTSPAKIVAFLERFPGTTHPIHEAQSFVFDACSVPGLGPDGQTAITISLHGHFLEAPSGGRRSFDRLFVLIAAPPNTTFVI